MALSPDPDASSLTAGPRVTANRPQQLTLPPPRTWTRTDFAALRVRAARAARDHRSAVLRSGHRAARDTIGYTYDMGDDWHHAVEIEAEVQPSPRIRYPRCVAGRRACPPEDCGSPPGYAHLLRTLAGRMMGARRELLDWLGVPFDPDAFRVAEVNARLANMGSGWE